MLTAIACGSAHRIIKKRSPPEKASSVKGVNYDKPTSKWLVWQSVEGKQKFSGRFADKADAEAAANKHRQL